MLDDDKAGKSGSESLAKQLTVPFIAPDGSFSAAGVHDANALLLKDRKAMKSFLDKVNKEAVNAFASQNATEADEYLKSHQVKLVLPSFMDAIQNPRPSIPTGFQKLDAELGGGLYPGLIVLGAVSSLGKTALALQIADQIARSQKDVLFFSLEMSRNELIARSMSRLTYENSDEEHASTALWIMNGKAFDNDDSASACMKALREYETECSEHLFIEEGVGAMTAPGIRHSVEMHQKARGEAPVVFVDYLQILAPIDPRADARASTDQAVLELKRISRDFDTPVIAISSFNRMSYEEAVSMKAFKESGAIEYSADVLMGLQLSGQGSGFNIQEALRKEERSVETVLLKNRNGRSGSVVGFSYLPRFNFFSEN